MKLRELLKNIEVLACTASLEEEITAICYDSRKAVPGCLFVAVSVEEVLPLVPVMPIIVMAFAG